jgi:hypothetical protein
MKTLMGFFHSSVLSRTHPYAGVSECIASVRRHLTFTQWITHYLSFPTIVSVMGMCPCFSLRLFFIVQQ